MSEPKVFFSPRLTGARFNNHAMPVDILEDFSALEGLLKELAKKIYLEENPNRKRVPKGFLDDFYITLSKIDNGSSIPIFILVSTLPFSNTLSVNESETSKYLELAKNKVISVIESANKDEVINLGVKQINYFNKIGKNLQDDEAIDFGWGSNSRTDNVLLNKESRRKILLSREDKIEYTESINVYALIPSINKKNKIATFEIDGEVVEYSLKEDFIDTIYLAFNEYERNTLVSIKALGVYNRNSKLIRIDNIDSMEVLDPFDISVRLRQLSKLKKGWYEGYGEILDNEKLYYFEQIFLENYKSRLKLPAIFPTPEGNIQLEWSKDDFEIIVELNLMDFRADLVYFDKNEEDEHSHTLNLQNKNDWSVLNNLIEKYIA